MNKLSYFFFLPPMNEKLKIWLIHLSRKTNEWNVSVRACVRVHACVCVCVITLKILLVDRVHYKIVCHAIHQMFNLYV